MPRRLGQLYLVALVVAAILTYGTGDPQTARHGAGALGGLLMLAPFVLVVWVFARLFGAVERRRRRFHTRMLRDGLWGVGSAKPTDGR